MWEQLNGMYLLVREAEREKVWNEEPGAIVRAVIEGAHLFHGVTDATLSHGEGWHYIQHRPLHRTRDDDGGDARKRDVGAPAPKGRAVSGDHRGLRRVGRAAARVRGVRGLYAATTRPICGRSGSPSSCCSNAEFPRSVRFAADRVEDSLRAIARPARPAVRTAVPSGLPDACVPRSITARSTRSWRTIRCGTSTACGKQCDQVHTALYQTYITYPIEAAIAIVDDVSRRASRIVMQYLVRHLTRFIYTSPVSESVMELRMQPLPTRRQRLPAVHVTTTPRARVFAYRDHPRQRGALFRSFPGGTRSSTSAAEAAVDMSAAGRPAGSARRKRVAGDRERAPRSGDMVDWLRPASSPPDTGACRNSPARIGLTRDARIR